MKENFSCCGNITYLYVSCYCMGERKQVAAWKLLKKDIK